MAKRLPTMAHVWLEIARLIRNGHMAGPYLCNLAHTLRRERRITAQQFDLVIDAVDEERRRQGVVDVLFKRANYDDNSILRIQFCTEQIRRIGREAGRK